MSERAAIPKIVWSLWLQGWHNAPRVARACIRTWQAQNPTWRVHRLDRATLPRFLPESELPTLAPDEHPAAQSDQIRIALLHRYGGVWADATTMCMVPLDTWLPLMGQTGFFAFSRPAEDRMLASWFLAAERGSYIVECWRQATVAFWEGRPPSENLDDYFWFHHLFGDIYDTDEKFRRAWNDVPVISANHRGHFGPFAEALLEPAGGTSVELVETPPATVLKLTHKLPDALPRDSLLERLCEATEGLEPPIEVAPKRLLVSWYGSFRGHGTVGDLLALEALVTHLVARGHLVSHATADAIVVTGSTRVQWDGVEPDNFDCVLFVCGPILSFHPQTNALFQRFAGVPLAGVGVSMMPADHPHHANPFRFILAREGRQERHGDLAIAAPRKGHARAKGRPKIGLSLRGYQTEYGEDRCRWQETEALARDLAKIASEQINADIVEIENHLARSGRSASEIEDQYGECRLVITSRFHGAIAALRQGVPYLAIDQIEGGAKLNSLLSPLPWPHVYRIDLLNADELRRTCIDLTTQRHHPLLFETRNVCVSAASETLAALDEWLNALP